GDAQLDLALSGSAAISASMGGLSHDINGLAVGASVVIPKTITVTCSGAGSANVVLQGAVDLTAPIDSFDGMPVNDTARLAFSVQCLPSLYASRKLDLRNFTTIDAPAVYGGNDFRLGTDA